MVDETEHSLLCIQETTSSRHQAVSSLKGYPYPVGEVPDRKPELLGLLLEVFQIRHGARFDLVGGHSPAGTNADAPY
ncbi:hypothetical protein ACK9YZ_00185 [Rhizobium sp. ZK1]|uniref:hypothetical protein n=1 Tax=Rhizobium sp. ZK1 TaxID=3389872 RepID=UPI0039F707FC